MLFSPAERSFLGVLNQAVGDSAKIFAKVRVADIVTPTKGLSRSDWQKAFNKISGKHFDFLLCSNDNLSVICAIELDDSSHKSNTRQGRDEFLTGVCDAASIPFIQIESVTDEKICPKCSSPMVRRIAKKGRNAGKQFWACNAFPKCRYIENYG